MFLLALRPFLPLFLRGAAILAALLLAWWMWTRYVADPYIAEGVAREHQNTAKEIKRAEDAEGANKTLTDDLAALNAKYDAQNSSVAALGVREAEAVLASQATLKKLRASETNRLTEITRLQTLALAPPAITKDADCEDTRQLVDAALARRLRK